MSFEEKLNRLEEINENMKDGEVPIEKAMKLFPPLDWQAPRT